MEFTQELFNDWVKRAYDTAKEHGFHEEEHSREHYFMLVVTEVSEAVNAHRRGDTGDMGDMEEFRNIMDGGLSFEKAFSRYVKDSIGDELADVCINPQATSINTFINIKAFAYLEGKSFAEGMYWLCRALLDEDYSNNVRVEYAIALVAYMCERESIDLKEHIELKMRYNALRPMLNGKKY